MKHRRYLQAAVLAAATLFTWSMGDGGATPQPALQQATGNDTGEILRRLVAADRALRTVPIRPDAHYVRARTLEVLGLPRAAAEAYRKYLKEDQSYRWAAEARRRLRALPRTPSPAHRFGNALSALRRAALADDSAEVERLVRLFPQEARMWGEKECLAEWAYGVLTHNTTHVSESLKVARAIGAALVAVNQEWLLSDAVAAIDRADAGRIAALTRGHTVYVRARRWSTADPERSFATAAAALAEAGSPLELAARNELGDVSPETVPAKYRALVAKAQQRQGTDKFMSEANLAVAHEMLDRAANTFKSMDERTNEASARINLAHLSEPFGDPLLPWQSALQASSRAGDFTVAIVLREMARVAMAERDWAIARSLLSIAMKGRQPPFMQFNLLLMQTSAAWRNGDITAAKNCLEDARGLSSAATLGQGPMLVLVAEALTVGSADRAGSTKLLADALTQTIKGSGRARPRSPADAAEDLRFSYYGADDIYADFAGIVHDQGNAEAAFALTERGRDGSLLLRMGVGEQRPLTAEQVQRSLAPGTVVVSILSLDEQLLIFTIDHRGLRATRVKIGRSSLEQLIARDRPSRLYPILLGSIDPRTVKTLVVVPDKLLARVSFATLIDSRTNRFVADTTDVIVAPSATAYVALAAMANAPRESAVVVGDPAFDGNACLGCPVFPLQPLRLGTSRQCTGHAFSSEPRPPPPRYWPVSAIPTSSTSPRTRR
jgi:tetratricopeptide (TPR) repeat protein